MVFSGCMHKPAPNLPAHWDGAPIKANSLADADQPRMNIFVVYSQNMCSHTVLRIYSPEHGTVFWDPAGGYGKPDYPVVAKRSNDLVIEPIPTIPKYLSFRQYLPTAKMEIFEFKLEPNQAEYLINQLRPAPGERRAPVKTMTGPMFCATTISKFLNQHASDVIQVKKTFFPHALSANLYDSNPDRIVVYDPNNLLEYEVQAVGD